jgi:hypothetical protein
MPPIQCVKLLQNKISFVNTSTFVKILAPVVVKPELASKKASIRDGIDLLKTKGKEPKKDIRIQLNATIAKPSLAYIFFVLVFIITKGIATHKIIIIVYINDRALLSG